MHAHNSSYNFSDLYLVKCFELSGKNRPGRKRSFIDQSSNYLASLPRSPRRITLKSRKLQISCLQDNRTMDLAGSSNWSRSSNNLIIYWEADYRRSKSPSGKYRNTFLVCETSGGSREARFQPVMFIKQSIYCLYIYLLLNYSCTTIRQ